jgi:type I restriction enzyme M protein
MAFAENIGYDAAGRKTYRVSIEQEGECKINGKSRVERHSCDLFDWHVEKRWSATDPKRPDWSEYHREIIPGTGLVAKWQAFQKDPKPFFV